MLRYKPTYSQKIQTAILRLSGMALIIMFFSCSLDNHIDVEVPEQVPAIVIEGYLSPGFPVEIAVSRNNLMDDELILQPIWNASAYITDRYDTLFLTNIFSVNSSRMCVFNYIHDSTAQLFYGDRLYLSVITRQGDTLYAETERPVPLRINSIGLKNKNLNMSVTTDGAFTGYARVDLAVYVADTVTHNESKFIQIPGSPDDIQLPFTSDISMADSLSVKFFHITAAYFDYWFSLFNARNAYSDPFLTPEAIRSNIANGIGIFTYYTFDVKTVYPLPQD
jgi:hypothetical protein